MDKKCSNKAEFRYTWPGKDEAFICQEHAFKMRRIVEAMGMYVQIIPLTPTARRALRIGTRRLKRL